MDQERNDVPTTSSGSGTTLSDKDINYMLGFCCVVFLILAFVAGLVTAIVLDKKPKLPHFQLEFVSVNANSTAVWDIVFSLDRSAGDSLDVWVQFMSRDYHVESVGSAGNATVSVTTVLPQGGGVGGIDFPGGLTLEQVKFRCRNYQSLVVEAACKDVAVGFSSNDSTQGTMIGGPRLCPVVSRHEI